MAKVITVLAFLIVLMSKCNALMPFPTPPYCRSIIGDMMGECKPYFMGQNSQPNDSCCSAIEFIVATAYGCICDVKLEIDNLPLDVTNTTKLLTICGVSLPCQLHVSGAPSPGVFFSTESPADTLRSYTLENLVSSLAPKSESSSHFPTQRSSKPQPSYAPNSSPPAPPEQEDQASLPEQEDEDNSLNVTNLVAFFALFSMSILMQLYPCIREGAIV